LSEYRLPAVAIEYTNTAIKPSESPTHSHKPSSVLIDYSFICRCSSSHRRRRRHTPQIQNHASRLSPLPFLSLSFQVDAETETEIEPESFIHLLEHNRLANITDTTDGTTSSPLADNTVIPRGRDAVLVAGLGSVEEVAAQGKVEIASHGLGVFDWQKEVVPVVRRG